MIAVVLTFRRHRGPLHLGVKLHTVTEMSSALRPFLGAIGAKVLLGTAVLGAALVAALVASLAGAWGIAEVFGWTHSLNERPDRNTAKFYLTYALAHVLGATIVLLSFESCQRGDRRGSDERVAPADRARLLVGAGKPALWRASTGCAGHGASITTTLCLVVVAFGLYLVPATLGWV